MRRRFIIVCALLCVARDAGADDGDLELKTKRMEFAEREGNLAVTTAVTELFDKEAYERLTSGFPTTVLIRAWIYPKDQDIPISYVIASHEAIYDLWDNSFTVRSRGPFGTRSRTFRQQSDVLRTLTELNALPVAPLKQVPIGPHFRLALDVQLNPVSKELLAEMRRWLTKPAGKAQLDTSSSFFGNFVSVFVNPKLQAADRALRYKSQPFFRVTR